MGGFGGGGGGTGLQLGPSLSRQVQQDELSRFRRFGFEEDAGFAQTAANNVFARLGSDNPGRFAAFMAGLDPNKTISEQLGLALPGKAGAKDEAKPEEVDKKTPTQADAAAARARQGRQARSRRGRTSTISTSARGLESEATTTRPTLLGTGRQGGKTLLGQ